jgi:hypothetical protein
MRDMMSTRLTALSAAAVLGAFLTGCGGGAVKDDMKKMGAADLSAREMVLVDEWDALAKEILKVHPNETPAQNLKEKQIMGDLLVIYKMQADNAFASAKAAKPEAQAPEIESAILAVTKLGKEGDKRVNDIKMALQKGGHHYSKAESSEEEYIFISPKAKMAFMEEAAKLRGLLAAGKPATAAEIDMISISVSRTFDDAMKMKT